MPEAQKTPECFLKAAACHHPRRVVVFDQR